MRLMIAALAVGALFPQLCLAQTEQQLRMMPSSAEILELANKADENIQGFEKALKASSPYLDKDTVQTDQEAANYAHTIISGIRKDGDSMYRLVALLATLDDLTLDASRASRSIMVGIGAKSLNDNSSHSAAAMTAMSLLASENSLYDISDLLMHTTLRYAAAEEDLMGQLLKKLK